MHGNRHAVTAKEFCDSVRDGTHDSPKPVAEGRYLVTSRHILNGRIDLSNAYLISQQDFEAVNKRSKVDRWDVLLSMIGTVGEPCLIKEYPDFAIKNIGLFKTKGEVDGKWLYYYLKSPEAQQLLRSQSRGTTQAYIPLGVLREFPIKVPDDVNEQRAIVHILGTLDDKIELNRRMNETLEGIAHALFKSWFVDFAPVRAKAEGRQPVGLDAETAALFPESFQESELGLIPAGWTSTVLGNVVELFDSMRIPLSGREREKRPGPFPYYGASGIIDYVDDYIFDGQYLLIAEDGENLRTRRTPVAFLAGDKFWVNNHAHIVRGTANVSTEHVMLHLQSCNITPFLTGAVQPKLSQGNLKRIPFLLPTTGVCGVFTYQIAPLFEKTRANQEQSRTLTALRDMLLPKLISGEIRVPDAEQLLAVSPL